MLSVAFPEKFSIPKLNCHKKLQEKIFKNIKRHTTNAIRKVSLGDRVQPFKKTMLFPTKIQVGKCFCSKLCETPQCQFDCARDGTVCPDLGKNGHPVLPRCCMLQSEEVIPPMVMRLAETELLEEKQRLRNGNATYETTDIVNKWVTLKFCLLPNNNAFEKSSTQCP